MAIVKFCGNCRYSERMTKTKVSSSNGTACSMSQYEKEPCSIENNLKLWIYSGHFDKRQREETKRLIELGIIVPIWA